MADHEFEGTCEPGDEEWKRRYEILMADPIDAWWWLSFVDENGANLGICIVPGGNVIQASKIAWELQCNPGGEVSGMCLKPFTPQQQYQCRLIPTEEARAVAALPLEQLCDLSVSSAEAQGE